MFKRLEISTGEIADTTSQPQDSDDKIIRPAILVHAGEDGSEIEFQSGDGPIKFDKLRIKKIIRNQNKQISQLAEQYGGLDKMPVGAYPPILDQHENDSNNRVVGRLASLLRYEKRDVPKIGKNVPCIVADITFLGKDTVDKVKDGRIYHLSIGIDEETDTLGETSVVIQPAAPGAMLLKKKEINLKRLQKANGGLMAKKKVKLEAKIKRVEKLAKLKESLTTLSTKLDTASKQVRLTKRQGDVTHRLHSLMKNKKLMPAEFKKLSVEKLAKLSDEALDVVMSSFEAREDVIQPSQKGSVEAVNFAQIGKDLEKTQLKRMKAEIRGDFKKMGMKHLKEEEYEKELSGSKEYEAHPGKSPGAVEDQAGDEEQLKHMYAKHLSDLKKHLEDGNVEEAKKVHEKMAAHHELHGVKHLEHSDVKSEDYKDSMANLQSQVDELNTNLARMAGMVDELMDVEKEEGHEELGHEEEEHKKLKEEDGEEEEHELSEEEKEDKKLKKEIEEQKK